jgi:hypothetical protein
MDGYIVNKSGKAMHIFKQRFIVGNKIYMKDIWPLYQVRVADALGKEDVSEVEFVDWLISNSVMREGFEYCSGEKEKMGGEIAGVTNADGPPEDLQKADGRLVKPLLAHVSHAVVDKLTYSDIVELRVQDDPARILSMVTNISKLRRAYTKVRTMPRKRSLERLIRNRIQDLEQL